MSVSAPVKLTLKDYKSDLHNDWCPGCALPSTRIMTRDGIKRIDSIEVGDRVLGHDGAYHRVTEVMSHWHPAPLHRLTVRNLGDVTLTDDHPVFILRGDDASHDQTMAGQWLPARDVEAGDYVAYPVPHETFDEELPIWHARRKKDTRSRPLPSSLVLDHDFMRLAGYFIAEGHTHHREILFTFNSSERHLAEDVKQLVGRIFELPASITERPAKHTLDVRVCSSYLSETFVKLFGHRAKEKRIPQRLMRAHPARQASLLRGLWAGDGWIGSDRAVYTTISPVLAQQVRVLLLRQGAIASFDVHPANGIHQESYKVAVSSAEDFNVLAEIMETPPVLFPRTASPRVPSADGYVFLRVSQNEIVPYKGFVHNLEVEDVHSYVTDAAALHNCGDFGILTGIQMAIQQMQIDPDKLAVFSGIGCSGKTPHYINAYGFHTLHGRVLTVATGGRLANTDLTVIALGSDGDGYGIGAGYFVGTGRRNVDFTYIVHNNNVYGLTKGQASPTLSKGKKTKSMPEQAIQDGINPVAMAVASGYTFIARAYALEPKYLASIIVKAVEHKGSALVDVLQTCPTYNDLYTKEWYEGADLPEKRSRLYKLEERGYDGRVSDPTDQEEIVAKKAAAVARSYETDPIPIGIYYQVELPTYEDAVAQRIPALAEKPLVEQDVFHRDVTPLLEAMR